MTPLLDVRTMVLIYVGIRMGLAVVLLYLWKAQRSYPPARDWAIGALLSALGLFLFVLRDLAPLFWTNVMANALLLPGTMIFNFGIIRATGKSPRYKAGFALCAVAIALMTWLTYAGGLDAQRYPAQVLTQNAVLISLDLYTAFACFRGPQAKNITTFRLLGSLFVVLVAACCWRVAGGVFGATLSLPPTLPRIVWIATSLIIFPMITALLTLHTSQRLQAEINEQARHDALTGAFNRRALDELADHEWAKAIRYGSPFSVLTIDIDHFKQFNDKHGHHTGDVTLIEVSNTAKATLRSDDIWFRYGGEEFVALLPNTSLEQALAIAERLRQSVEQTTIAAPGGLLSVSVSIGAAERTTPHLNWTEVLAISDAALYRAKAAGRNCVVAGGSEVDA